MHMRFGHSGSPKVLVVDDEPAIVTSTVAILRERGYDVQGALSGEEAVAEAASLGPDLLISDISMYRMNGIEAAAHITAMFPECRVLFLSGLPTLAEIGPSMPPGLVYSFARKPLPLGDLLDCVATLRSVVESLDPRLPAHEGGEMDWSAFNQWRWAFYGSRRAELPGAATSANIPDARKVRLNPRSGRDAKFMVH